MTPSYDAQESPTSRMRSVHSFKSKLHARLHASPDNVVSDHSDNETSDVSQRASRRCRAKFTRHRIKHYVEHNYHDHKHDPIEFVLPNIALIDDDGYPRRAGHRGGVSTPFPEKLHELLETASEQGLDEIIGWQPHGRCFVVHKPKEFVEAVMTK